MFLKKLREFRYSQNISEVMKIRWFSTETMDCDENIYDSSETRDEGRVRNTQPYARPNHGILKKCKKF